METKEKVFSLFSSIEHWFTTTDISSRSSFRASELPKLLSEFGFESKYISGAVIMKIEDRTIPVIRGSTGVKYRSVFITYDDDEGYVPIVFVLEELAHMVGIGHKEPPFLDAVPAVEYLFQHYINSLRSFFSKEN